MRAALVLTITCALSTAAAADATTDALGLVQRGVDLFKAGDLPAAREAFARARALVPDKANPYRWLGLVDAQLGRCADAVGELDTFLSKIPADDARAAEAIVLRDRCKAELQPHVGTVVVDSEPPGAAVRLDDAKAAPAGVTPFQSATVSAGHHVVFLHKAGFVDAAVGVEVTARETTRVQVPLERAAVAEKRPDLAALTAEIERQRVAAERERERRVAAAERTGRVERIVGGVMVGAGVALAALAFTLVADANNQMQPLKRLTPDDTWTFDANVAAIKNDSNTMIAMWSVGGTVAVAGAITAIIGAVKRSHAEARAGAQVAPLVVPGGGGLDFGGRF